MKSNACFSFCKREMVGNESYNDSYNGKASASQYRDDIIEFSRRMKAVDPSIKIIANGDVDSWWATVLPSASPYIDFLGVSNYPIWNYTGGYDHYKNNVNNLMGAVKIAEKAINSYALAQDKERIKVISTEFNANDWVNTWTNANDLGHSLTAFEILGEHLKDPKVEAALLWNTRWINNTSKTNDIFDAINKDGNLEPSGVALSIWGNNLLNEMVHTTSTTAIRSFASYNKYTKNLNVFIINKELSSQQVSLNINNYIQNANGERWELKGSGPSDLSPLWSKKGTETVNINSLGLNLPAVSITMLTFKPAAAVANSDSAATNPNPVINTNENISLTSISSFEVPMAITVFPNPANNKINIGFSGCVGKKVKLRVLSSEGKECYASTQVITQEFMELNTSKWAKGIYFVLSNDGTKTLSKKVVLY